MEKNQIVIQKQSEISNAVRIKESDTEILKQVLRYIIVILGLPEHKVPKDEMKDAMLFFIKNNYGNMTNYEMREAFDLALKNEFEVDLNLYDRSLNSKYISDVFNAYKVYKAKKNVEVKQLSQGEEATTLKIRTASIMEIIKKRNPETIDKINEIAKKSQEDKLKIANKSGSTKVDLHQMLCKEFYELNMEQDTASVTPGTRVVWYKEKTLDLQNYVNSRISELSI